MRLAGGLLFCAVLLSVAVPAWAAPRESYLDAGAGGALKGTLLTPETPGPAAVVLIIPGSGHVDRDGNSPEGVKAAPYRRLAEALAAAGVASVRIDKHGMFASGGAGDANKATFALYAAETHAWLAAIRNATHAPCVWIAGHSEGGLTALVAAQDPRDICGLVLISTAGRKTGELLRAQFRAIPQTARFMAQIDPAIDSLEAGRKLDVANSPVLAALFPDVVQDFLIDDFRQDPVGLLKAYKGPVLVLQGDNDLNVSLEDAKLLEGARSGVTAVVLPGVNHMLKVVPRDRAANAASYADPSLPLAPGVAEAIADFVKRP